MLRLQYKRVSVLLGGDLNIPSEHRLLEHHTGLASPPAAADEETLVRAGRKVFQSDIAKACHHGSADFTDLFLRSDEGYFGRQQFLNEAAPSGGRCWTEGKHRVFAKRSKLGHPAATRSLSIHQRLLRQLAQEK